MSEVHLLSADARSWRFRWISSGGLKLNRKNKCSSETFVVSVPPNGTTHTFRIVMLRGVIRRDVEANDHFGVFLEYIPSTETTSYPGSVDVIFRAGSPESTAAIAEHALSGELSRESRTVGVKEFLSPAQYGSACFPGTDAVCVDIDIKLGVALVETVVAVSKTWGSSLWGSATASMVSLTSQVTTMGDRLKHALDDAFHFNRSEEGSAASSSTASPQALPPWESVPKKWANRPHRWVHYLTVYLPQNELVFLVGPRPFSSEEELALIEAGLSANACTAAAAEFNEDRDIHEALLSQDQRVLRAARFELVPARLSDVQFWRNYFWRVNCLRLCSSDDQAQILLSILNAPLVASAPNRSQSSAVADQDSPITKLRHAATVCEECLQDHATDGGTDFLAACTQSLACALRDMRAKPNTSDDSQWQAAIDEAQSILDRSKSALAAAAATNSSTAAVEVEDSPSAVQPETQSAVLPSMETEEDKPQTPAQDFRILPEEEQEEKLVSPQPVPARGAQESTPLPHRPPSAEQEEVVVVKRPLQQQQSPLSSAAVAPPLTSPAAPESKTHQTSSATSAAASPQRFPLMPWEEEDE